MWPAKQESDSLSKDLIINNNFWSDRISRENKKQTSAVRDGCWPAEGQLCQPQSHKDEGCSVYSPGCDVYK